MRYDRDEIVEIVQVLHNGSSCPAAQACSPSDRPPKLATKAFTRYHDLRNDYTLRSASALVGGASIDSRITLKVTKEKAAENHKAILLAASRLFREHGFDGVGVVEVMKAAGLTHGAFYGHFSSKSALAAEACKFAFDELLEAWTPDITVSDYIDRYISVLHRDKVANGCPMASFASEIDRQEKPVRQQFAKGVEGYIGKISDRLTADGTKNLHARKKAAAILSAMIGSVVMARSMCSVDRQLSADILSEARRTVQAQFGV
jgi:TetR/AcrR family transcriptional repressor of nem operon